MASAAPTSVAAGSRFPHGQPAETIAATEELAAAPSYTILVASGDKDERQRWAEMLMHHDCRFLFADSGEAVLDAVEARSIDMVIAAVTLGRPDGLEILRMMRGRTSPPVVLISGRDDDIDLVYLKLARISGAAGAYSQPFDIDRFRLEIRALLSRVRLV